MRTPILKQGNILIVSIQEAQSDKSLNRLRNDLGEKIGEVRAHGVVIDVTALDIIDSFAARTLQNIAHAARLRGAQTVIAGIQPEVAITMVQLGLTLAGVATALDLDEGLALLREEGKTEDERDG